MRIGFITGSLRNIGSGQIVALPLSRALRSEQHQVFGLDTNHVVRHKINVNGLEVFCEPSFFYLADSVLAKFRLRDGKQDRAGEYDVNEENLFFRAQCAALQNQIERLAIDVVYAFHNSTVARILSGWPHPSRLLVISLIGFGIDPSRGGQQDTFPIQEYLFKHPYWDLHIAATRFEFQQYQMVYRQLGLDPSKLLYLPHSYDQDFYYPQEGFSDSVDRNGPEKLLLYPVNVYPRKNIELAIDVLALVNEVMPVELVVTGNIWDRRYLETLLQRANFKGVQQNVKFLGGVSLDHLRRLYHQADVTVFTSHQETFGLGIVESLGSGTPVVGPDWIIPCREILNQNSGGWYSSKDANSIASLVLNVLNSPPDPHAIAAEARSSFGNKAVAQKFMMAVGAIKQRKDARARDLKLIDWKGLYEDAGDLL